MTAHQFRTFASSPWRRIFCSLLLVAVIVAAAGAFGLPRATKQQGAAVSSSPSVTQKIAPWVMEHTDNNQQAEFFVVLANQAELSHAASLQTKTEKGRYVYDALLNKAQTTQAPILRWLCERGVEYRSFYIVNTILVKGTREVAEALASRPDVARVEGNPEVHNNLPRANPAIETAVQHQAPETIAPGIAYTHAPEVWALGYTGQNIVIGSEDSGVRWTHNALKSHYRGWDGQNADHNYNWHDAIHDSVGNPCGNDSPFPCDDSGHGSHTTGTAVGDDGMGNQIGMAPGAKWIACRNIDGVANLTTPARTIECMEFFLAPYPIGGGQGDPTKAPDITINSWDCAPADGCSVDTLQTAVEAQAAAGIMMVVAAQNYGPGCSTVENPPGIYEAAYTVGALNTGTDVIADFSSRGPVIADGSGRIKPDITAPGNPVRSCWNTSDNAYALAEGTSMATPHISGAMALLWSAIPSLKNQIDSSRITMNNAAHLISSTQCGDAGPPNNVYGWGRVDILAAVGGPTPSPTPTPTPTGTPTPTPCGLLWIERAPLPYNAGGVFAVSDGIYVYAGGGTDLANGIVHKDLLRYDPSNDSWTALPPSPDYHALSPAVYFNDKIYNSGGYDEKFNVTNTTRIYDIETNTWTTGAPMPEALTQMATALWDGAVYVAGGNLSNGQPVNTLYAYNIGSDTWTMLPAMPQALTLPGFGVINGKLYIAGGFNGALLNTLYIYDIAANTWTTGANLPQAIDGPGSSVFNGRLYLYGGKLPGPILTNMTWIYDPANNTWSSHGPNMNVAHYAFYGAAVGNESIVAPGGLDANLFGLNDNEQLINNPCPSPTPTPRPSPTPRLRPTPRQRP